MTRDWEAILDGAREGDRPMPTKSPTVLDRCGSCASWSEDCYCYRHDVYPQRWELCDDYWPADVDEAKRRFPFLRDR